jgi:hypothetical protein
MMVVMVVLYVMWCVAVQDADEEVALEAAEFWLAYCESDLGLELLQPVMGRLIPVLMINMVGRAGGGGGGQGMMTCKWLPGCRGWRAAGGG